MTLGDRALVALVRRRVKGRRGVVVWVDAGGVVRVVGEGDSDTFASLAWGLDVAYRVSGRGIVGERVRLSGVRRTAHAWAERARAK